MSRRLICILIAALVTGCASTAPLSVPIVVPDTPVVVPAVQPLSLAPVQWQVLPPAAGRANPLFALDEANYSNFTLNLNEIKRFISEQKAVIAMLGTINQQRAARGVPVTPTQSSGPTALSPAHP